MTLGPLAFAALVWGSLASVLAVSAYLLWVVLREAGVGEDSRASTPEVDS